MTPPKKKKKHPDTSALLRLFEKMDGDKEGWFPGKSYQTKHGPDPAINGTNQSVIARSAMNLKEKGEEVTYSAVVSHNPKASLNPVTNRPVDKKAIYKVLKRKCHDDANDPDDAWVHDYKYYKKALTEGQIEV